MQSFTMGQHPGAHPRSHPTHASAYDDVVDGEYSEVQPDTPQIQTPSDNPSGWTKDQ